MTILEALAKVHNGQGYMVIRNPYQKGRQAIEFHEVGE